MQDEPVVQAVREMILPAWADTNKHPIGLAVSGGIDSMVLLHAALRVASEHHGSLAAFHVNHGVRDAATADAAWVVSICEQWGVPVEVLGIHRETIPQAERKGLEADLRRLRYEAIAVAAMRKQVGTVVLGHHADDLAETMVWRLTRGTSLSGLASIRRTVVRLGVCWLRPLLSVSKHHIRDYATRHAVPYREDETNNDVAFQRNLIRHQVIPILKKINPQLTETLLRTADILQSEDEHMEAEAHKLVRACRVPMPEGVRINLTTLHSAPIPLQRRAIKILLYCLTSVGWSSVHVARVMVLAGAQNPSAEADVGHGVYARREYNTLVLKHRSGTRRGHDDDLGSAVASVVWHPDQKTHVVYGDRGKVLWRFVCTPWDSTRGYRSTTHYEAHFPSVSSFSIRPPKPGEKVQPFGMEGSKKLQDVFTDAKVPQHLRKDWPLLCCGGEVAWVPGLLRCRTTLLTSKHQSGWTIHAERIDEPIRLT